jgi:hypothetical protein
MVIYFNGGDIQWISYTATDASIPGIHAARNYPITAQSVKARIGINHEGTLRYKTE